MSKRTTRGKRLLQILRQGGHELFFGPKTSAVVGDSEFLEQQENGLTALEVDERRQLDKL